MLNTITITRSMIYGILIQIVRQERNLLQDAISTTISRYSLSAYETGVNKLTIELLVDICKAINVDMVLMVDTAERVYKNIDKEYILRFADMNTRPKQRWLAVAVRNQFRSEVLKLIHSTELST